MTGRLSRNRLFDVAPVRKIIHVDMDAFYTSVEQRDRPELRGKPVVVGGSPEGRGVVASASYEARRFGIRSAMSARRAIRVCPNLIFVRPDFARYKEVSRQIRSIFLDVTDLVEPLSLDEAYLEVTTNKLLERLATKIAQHIRARIRDELHLTASAGVGPNKFIAKIASDLKKPDGLVVIPPEKVFDFVGSLPVEKLWGVGPATAQRLHSRGIQKAGDIRQFPINQMEHWFGRFGRFLHQLSHGIDDRPVSPDRVAKSRGAETTFAQDVRDKNQLTATLKDLSLEVSESLQRLERLARTIVLKVRYSDFTTLTRSRTTGEKLQSAESILAVALSLIENTEAGRRPVRLVGISATGLWDPTQPSTEDDSQQLQLNF